MCLVFKISGKSASRGWNFSSVCQAVTEQPGIAQLVGGEGCEGCDALVEDLEATFDFTALRRPEDWLTFAVPTFAELVGAVLLVAF